jgi:hypothetical protein
MAAIKLKPGETVVIAAIDPALYPDQGLPGSQPHPDHTLPTPPDQANDPWYGIDLGLGYLRPDNTLPTPPGRPSQPPPVDPGYGIDEDTGWVHPDHELPVPPPPVDPAWGIDIDLGYLRPDNSLPVPPDQKPEGAKWEIKTAWTPTTGWIVVAVPTGVHVTPSKA